MCKVGLTLHQVSFLHDGQAVTHMVRQLSELISKVTEEQTNLSGSEQLLRGLAAEEAGMWLIGVSCLVDVISSSSSVNTTLMDDFESAGGRYLLVEALRDSAPERLMSMLDTITGLFFDPKKGRESIAYPNAGSILIDFMKNMLGLSRAVEASDNLTRLIEVSSYLYVHKDRLLGKEHVIQNIGYLLLTIYSSDTLNCDILEENYYYLSLLIIRLGLVLGLILGLVLELIVGC
jgi:hypothetical protein